MFCFQASCVWMVATQQKNVRNKVHIYHVTPNGSTYIHFQVTAPAAVFVEHLLKAIIKHTRTKSSYSAVQAINVEMFAFLCESLYTEESMTTSQLILFFFF